MDLEVLGMDSYYNLIVTMALSSTVWPECTGVTTDRQGHDNSPSYAYSLQLLHRWAKNTVFTTKTPDNGERTSNNFCSATFSC